MATLHNPALAPLRLPAPFSKVRKSCQPDQDAPAFIVPPDLAAVVATPQALQPKAGFLQPPPRSASLPYIRCTSIKVHGAFSPTVDDDLPVRIDGTKTYMTGGCVRVTRVLHSENPRKIREV